MSDEKPANLETTIKSILMSKEFLESVHKATIVKRPPHTSKLSNFSYFREQFGLEMKAAMDMMVENQQNIQWRFSSYPELKPKTLYLRLNQSMKYLLTYLDPEGKYEQLRQMMVFQRLPTGWSLGWIRDKVQGKAFMPEVMDEMSMTEQYRVQIDEFLNDPTVGRLELKNLSLSVEEIKALQESFIGLEDTVNHLITDKEIKIVKINWKRPPKNL